MGNPVSHRFRRIVGYFHGVAHQIFDHDLFIRPHRAKQLPGYFPQGRSILDCLNGSLRGIDTDPILPGKHPQACNMVRVLMGNENPVNVPHRKIQFLKPRFRLLSADPHIHQKMGGVRAYINTISAAAAGNTANSHPAPLKSFPSKSLSYPHCQ